MYLIKYFTVLIMLSVSLTNCSAQKKQVKKNIKEVVFNAQTRGRLENITIVDTTIFYKTQSDSKTYTISTEERKKLITVIEKIALKTISGLKAPSNKRTLDAALHASVSIKIGDKNYTSVTFDDDNPPKKLKELVDLLKSFID